MKKTEEILNVKVPRDIANSLEEIGNTLHIPPDQVATMILESLFHEKRAPAGGSLSGRCALRKKINIPCVVKFSDSQKTMLYKSASLVDFSITGVGIVVHDTTKGLETIYKNLKNFELVLQIDDVTALNYNCKLSYWKRDSLLRLGGGLLSPDFSAFKKYLKLFMLTPPLVTT